MTTQTDTTTARPLLVVPIDRAPDHYPPAPRVDAVIGSAFLSEIDGRACVTDGRLVILAAGCRAARWTVLANRARFPHEVPHATHDHLRAHLVGWQEDAAKADEWQPTHVSGHPSAWADRGASLVRVTDGQVEEYGIDLARHRYLLAALKGCARIVRLSRAFGYVDKGRRLLAVCMAVRISGGSGRVEETTPDKPEAEAETTDAPAIPAGAEKTTKAALLRAISARGCELVAAVHRRPLADIVADALRADGPATSPCPVTVSGNRIARTLPDGRVSHAELNKHATAYRVGRHMWVVWSEYPATPAAPAHTAALVYCVP